MSSDGSRARESRAVVDPQLRNASPNGLDITRIAADKALNPGQNLRPASQSTQTLKPSDERLCLTDFNLPPTEATWLRKLNAALLAPIKLDTSFELLFGRIRLSRTEAPGCPLKSRYSPGS
jgi:hypothetical protein